MPTLFLYARKSTDVEDKQIMSIEAQLTELRQFAVREGLSIVEELIEKQSAKTPGRPIFNAMLARIEKGEAEGVLAWHPDRLARNSIDGGQVIYLLDTGKLKILRFPTFRFESDPQGKFMLSIMFGQSKYYVDSLSENTKRGLREKLRRGEYPSKAPIGYLNDYRTKKIIIDRRRATVVKEAFELYATGTATLDRVRAFFAERGLVTANGHPFIRAYVSSLLSNPFYYGHFRYGGEIYEGCHEAIISKALFDKVDAIMVRRWRYSPLTHKTVPKPFLGLLHCATCGGAITAEVQKGHTYYRCTKKGRLSGWCEQPYIREEALDAQLSDLLKSFNLRKDWADKMLGLLTSEKEQVASQASALVARKGAEIAKIKSRLQKLLDTFLDDLIDRAAFTAEKARLMSEKRTLEEQKAAHVTGRSNWLEPFQNWILTAKNAGEIAVSGSLSDKKALASKIFGSNLVLDCKKARGSAVKPWSLLTEKHQTGGVVPATGLEPVRCYSLEPESSASANSATRAC
jgi:site-specific DNA recombinase